MKIVTPEEVVRAIAWRFGTIPINSIELVGDEKSFGHFLVNDVHKLSVYIYDAEKMMDVAEKVAKDYHVLMANAWFCLTYNLIPEVSS